eukprot:2982635-Prymnesium_polylepis.1
MEAISRARPARPDYAPIVRARSAWSATARRDACAPSAARRSAATRVDGAPQLTCRPCASSRRGGTPRRRARCRGGRP